MHKTISNGSVEVRMEAGHGVAREAQPRHFQKGGVSLSSPFPSAMRQTEAALKALTMNSLRSALTAAPVWQQETQIRTKPACQAANAKIALQDRPPHGR